MIVLLMFVRSFVDLSVWKESLLFITEAKAFRAALAMFSQC